MVLFVEQASVFEMLYVILSPFAVCHLLIHIHEAWEVSFSVILDAEHGFITHKHILYVFSLFWVIAQDLHCVGVVTLRNDYLLIVDFKRPQSLKN